MKKNWTRDVESHSNLVDIMPLNDLIEHFYGLSCHCKPIQDGNITVHNAWDGREEVENSTGSNSVN